jgi:hypothetical protein
VARFTNPLTPGDWVEGYHGEFLSLVTQQALAANTPQAVAFETTVLSEGVTIEQDDDEYYTKITFANPGVYNIQFSGQIHHTGGGGGGEIFTMWFSKNGTAIPASRTIWHVANGKYLVPVVNILETIETPGDYVQLVGYPDNTAIVLEYTPNGGGIPAVPSLILTVTQVA